MKRKLYELAITVLICAVFPLVVIPFVFQLFPIPQGENQNGSFTDMLHRDDYMYDTVRVQMEDDTVREMPLEEYILCVVLKEMPADFHGEAIKAQAVVARTYTVRRMIADGKHSQADVCVNTDCCQGYRSVEEFLNAGGTQKKMAAIKKSVEETAGQILVYNSSPIEATYFSCSGGVTEDAVSVWGSDVPYLRSVSSPGEEKAKHYTDTLRFSVLELADKLGIRLDSKRDLKIGKISYTTGGGVDCIEICGKSFQGTSVRKLLGLRSTAFVITVAGDTATITTKGYGHRVGMSQYGADAMGNAGSDYREILFHYYQGVDLVSVDALY